MKSLKKVIVFLLLAVLTLSFVACGEEGGEDGPKVTPDNGEGKPTYDPNAGKSTGITEEMLSNYIIKYNITKTEFITDEEGNQIVNEDGTYKQEEVTRQYVEIGYANGLVLKSNDGGVSYVSDNSGVNCFTISSRTDDRGYFNAHCDFKENMEDLTEIGSETICGKECKIYQYKQGAMIDTKLYVNEELDLTLKYDAAFVMGQPGPIKMEVTSLEFGTLDYDKFAEYLTMIATPAPVEEEAAE